MILVVGATGMVGSEVCAQLVAKGKSVGAVIRPSADAAKVKKLEALGVELLEGDLRQPSTLEAACDRAQQVIVTVSSMPFAYQPGVNDIHSTDLQGVRNLIALAEEQAIEHFVYTSFSGNLDLEFPLRNAKREVEEELRASGMAYTILRPSCFMEVWLTSAVGFDAANARATIYGSGNAPISYISYRDVATFAVQSLDNPAAYKATLELGGPEAISQLGAVAIFEQVTDRKFELQFVPEEALKQQQAAADDPMQRSFVGLMRCVANGDAIDMRGTLKAFPGVKPLAVKEFAAGMMMPA
jgi:NADH dehydrogenase